MFRGTTPTIQFTLNQKLNFDVLFITFQQQNKTVLEKTLADCTVSEDGSVSLNLTQKETLLFKESYPVKIQLRGKVDGKALASQIITATVGEILKEGEI